MTWNLTPIKKTLQVKQKRKIGQLHDFYSGQCQEKGLVISKEFFFQDHSKSQVFRKAIEYCQHFSVKSLGDLWKAIVNMVDKIQLPSVVYDWNQVSVTETKVQFWYRYWGWGGYEASKWTQISKKINIPTFDEFCGTVFCFYHLGK